MSTGVPLRVTQLLVAVLPFRVLTSIEEQLQGIGWKSKIANHMPELHIITIAYPAQLPCTGRNFYNK